MDGRKMQVELRSYDRLFKSGYNDFTHVIGPVSQQFAAHFMGIPGLYKERAES
jgi:hypothetical protein